ncbi:Gfo/Idh/MocA family oxidoreductase [Candidatus Sumerlaeota bacterium]|nr:Gfo/Idh/MocA family oxidoreductase [Candidatus Sumerlaeota bacterium]
MGQGTMDRRRFLRQGASAGVTLAAAASLGKPRKAVAANDKITMGLIGCGGRGRSLMRKCLTVAPAVEFAAVCDVYEERRNLALKDTEAKGKTFDDHRRLLDMKEINAVVIATPDHHHVPQMLDAVSAGKDVYVEKPMTYRVEEGVRAIKAVRQSKQIVQVGMQRRSAPMCIEAKKLVDEGILGEVTLVRAQWFWPSVLAPVKKVTKLAGDFNWDIFLGQAPKRPFDPDRAARWVWYWDYSGGMVAGQGVHLLDLIQWFMGKGTPRSAVMMGGSQIGGYECPEMFSGTYEYDGFFVSWILSYHNSFDNGWKITFHGTKGTLVIGEPIPAEGERGYWIYKEPWRDVENRKPIRRSEEGLPDEPHIQNWIDCIRTRKQPNAPVEVGHTSSAACHIGIAALRNKTVAHMDKDCTKITV